MKTYIIFICAALLLTSCIDFTAPKRFTEQSYYLTGMLKAGKTVDFENPIIIGKTIPADGGFLNDLIVLDAEVILYELNVADVVLDSTSLIFSFNIFDEDQFGYIAVDTSFVIEAETKYRIKALVDTTDLIWADTTVPKIISVQPDPGYITDPSVAIWPEMAFENVDEEHPILVTTLDNETMNLHAEFYCLEEYDEAEYIFAIEDGTYPEDEYEYESGADGSPRRTTTFYIFQPNDNLINFSFYQYAFNFYGRYEVNVSSIDDNFLNYLYKPEGYNHGGIIGGIGYFGSANSHTMYTEIIE